ncbi:hypothetical protein QQF64_035441 [Cirrhinus molitorella]|uniref:BHLH domain-containing protein n=1 Tax=Cirrhinus molitorella TaxID=172907 RepID=A0ABR3NFV1_9TELE
MSRDEMQPINPWDIWKLPPQRVWFVLSSREEFPGGVLGVGWSSKTGRESGAPLPIEATRERHEQDARPLGIPKRTFVLLLAPFFFPLREMDITAKMEISVNQQQFMPPACFFASQSIQLSPTDSQCSSKSGSKQTKRQRSSSPELLRCKRRLNFAGFGYSLPQQQPHAVARRNERERNRVKLVNNGFATLREHVPNGAANKKMSKVETLRSAVEYIRALQQLLDEHDAVSAAFQSGVLSPTISQNYSNDMNSMAGSPVSSYSSDEGSYDPLSPEEQELLDFTNWF